MPMKPSAIKLEAFHDCPGADAVKEYLYEHNLLEGTNVVDVDEPHSVDCNTRDLVVLAIRKRPTAMQVALALGEMAVWLNADELTWRLIDGTYIVRLWWA